MWSALRLHVDCSKSPVEYLLVVYIIFHNDRSYWKIPTSRWTRTISKKSCRKVLTGSAVEFIFSHIWSKRKKKKLLTRLQPGAVLWSFGYLQKKFVKMQKIGRKWNNLIFQFFKILLQIIPLIFNPFNFCDQLFLQFSVLKNFTKV